MSTPPCTNRYGIENPFIIPCAFSTPDLVILSTIQNNPPSNPTVAAMMNNTFPYPGNVDALTHASINPFNHPTNNTASVAINDRCFKNDGTQSPAPIPFFARAMPPRT